MTNVYLYRVMPRWQGIRIMVTTGMWGPGHRDFPENYGCRHLTPDRMQSGVLCSEQLRTVCFAQQNGDVAYTIYIFFIFPQDILKLQPV